jgi:predicted transposase YdaD
MEKAAYTKEQLEIYDKCKIDTMTARSMISDALRKGEAIGRAEGEAERDKLKEKLKDKEKKEAQQATHIAELERKLEQLTK